VEAEAPAELGLRVLPAPTPIAAAIKLLCSEAMSRSRVPLEQLLADLRGYHSYLLQDPCANPRALAYVEHRLSYFHSMNSLKSDSTGSGELAGSQGGMSSSGRSRSSASREKEIANT